MKVFYINDLTNTVISLNELSKLAYNSKISVNYNDREILYSIEDIYKCREWKVYTLEEESLTLDDIRVLKKKVDKQSRLYSKLQKEEENLLNIYVEEISLESERSLF